MKPETLFKYLLPLLGFLLFGSCGRPAPSGAEAAPGRESLHQALDAFNAAYARADVAALDKMLVAGYLHTNGANPPLGKDSWLNYVSGRRKALDAGDLVIDSYTLLDLQVRLHGRAAAVAGKVRISGLDEDGPFENEFRVTQLWVYEDAGGWKRAAFHDGVVK
ncbi:MAG: nuclear transport factor 2 family protein [Lewinellaceae bacterium]|nr:nuclear transport factor 2 family protein [Lewinellaceae bacterium]